MVLSDVKEMPANNANEREEKEIAHERHEINEVFQDSSVRRTIDKILS